MDGWFREQGCPSGQIGLLGRPVFIERSRDPHFSVSVHVSHRKMLQSLGRPEVHMALDVTIVSGAGQEHAGCLLLTSEVLFVVSLGEDTQQQAFPVTEVECRPEPAQEGVLTLTLCQQRVASEAEVSSPWHPAGKTPDILSVGP